ncbi:1-deoxy-D-xylulose-5-phosphate synthase [Posidoniimonas polymericola]|uniref:1-deoxy-D-xylulose-5-phosphate synthase n=1 Tax=Posidoniimonas polymericola TaxID=2528002 RepID=A0A5C5YTC4_9BACT|nr:1-deoxy-D-xylulose-5-phosphate synthase [Posidoniimonas polymericola]TWT77983.1 1-deoxy-D-xylulose-5-phosphate synthase [Posidoniimonas polymericola]
MTQTTKKPILPTITSPRDLDGMSLPDLERLAGEIRDVLCNLVSARSAHFASNLGVVELCLALHQTFDFLHDRLIWDTGHQIYPHKLITGRYPQFSTIRTKGGLMGYPNPEESDYDLFVTGHAGSSVSTAVGLASGDRLLRDEENRWTVAVIGDGAFPSGVVYEALCNIRESGKRLLVVLNDNKMSICPRVGGMADYLDRLRMSGAYSGIKGEIVKTLQNIPMLGDPVERMLTQIKEAAKAGLHGGMLFEELGMRYVGPIDGHNVALVRKYLRMVRKTDGPVLLHVVTEKGHGFHPATQDPVLFHAPPQFSRCENGELQMKKSGGRAYTNAASEAIHVAMTASDKVTVLTAAMCQGNKLERVRDDFPDRFFDTGICEAHAVAFAAGQAKVGMRPIVDIYSTFLQRSFDHIFQEVALQNLPVTFMLDRGGLSGPDGATHHGVFDLGYLRLFPHMTVMAPGDEHDLASMLPFALQHNGPCAIRYPKAAAVTVAGERAPIEHGTAEVLRRGPDGLILCGGALLPDCLAAAEQLAGEGLELTVVNARFIKPLDTKTILPLVADSPFTVTVEEAALAGGFGSVVLEALADAGQTAPVRRLGIGDHYVEHGEREELLADLGLDTAGIAQACREQSQACAPGQGVS